MPPVPAPTAAELLARVKASGAPPRHVAIIMDGNGRWARERFLPRPLGHRSGMKAVHAVIEGALEVGLEALSLYAFSQENWQRPATEVSALMSLLEEYIQREIDNLDRRGVRVRILGDLDRLTPAAAAAVDSVVRRTAHNEKLVLNLFISYGARAELVRAARLIAEEVARGTMRADEVDEAAIAARLFTAGVPDPDLLIRTSGEQRISNFLLWQIAYAELYISPVLWPDFGTYEFYEAVLAYQQRERRFGRVSA